MMFTGLICEPDYTFDTGVFVVDKENVVTSKNQCHSLLVLYALKLFWLMYLLSYLIKLH